MNHEWKQEIDSIPLPSELRQRSLIGIEQAQAEIDEKIDSRTRKSPTRLNRKSVLARIIVGLLLLFLTLTVFQPQVIAAIQRALQFIPGIGIVKQEEKPIDRYVLKQPVTAQIGEGQIIVTGILVDEEMAYLTMVGNMPSQKPDEIRLVNQKGTEFVIKSSMSSWSTNQWSADYWYRGILNIQDGPAKIVIGQNDRHDIPLTLIKAETFGSYEEMGETVTLNDIKITAIASRDGEKGRLSLISQQPKNVSIVDYGLHGIYNGRKLSITDEAGKQREIEKIPGLSSPAMDFYFQLNPDQLKANDAYTLQIPEINVEFNDQATIRVPTQSVDHLNKTFSIAGFPVTITRTERLGDKGLRLYLDLHFDSSAVKSLHSLRIDGMSHSGKLNEQTGALEYIEFDLEPGIEEMKLTITRPEVLVRGPWTFQLPADKYFNP